MKRADLELCRCPACKGRLGMDLPDADNGEVVSGRMVCSCGLQFSITEGIPDLIHPARLLPSDEEFQRKYDQGAGRYDTGMEWLFSAFGENEKGIRTRMVDLLELQPGSRALDLGCGTGSDSRLIADRVGVEGRLFSMDISRGMLERACVRWTAIEPAPAFFLGNGSYLPFEDGVFDAVFHFGGLNTFSERRKALAEMARVVRRGGKVVAGDEGVAPWLKRKMFGRVLIKANPLYKHHPPLDLLPPCAREVCVRWLLGDAFYLIDFRVGEPPPLNMDLPIPGKGDTLRSRYYGSKARDE